jgi:hypothetical protein
MIETSCPYQTSKGENVEAGQTDRGQYIVEETDLWRQEEAPTDANQERTGEKWEQSYDFHLSTSWHVGSGSQPRKRRAEQHADGGSTQTNKGAVQDCLDNQRFSESTEKITYSKVSRFSNSRTAPQAAVD